MTDAPNFEGHEPRGCGEHRTVGPHRAWCHDCGEWCYPDLPCARCELPVLRVLLRDANELIGDHINTGHPSIGDWMLLRNRIRQALDLNDPSGGEPRD